MTWKLMEVPGERPGPTGKKGYGAFLSYSHDADPLHASALQSALENLARPWYRRPVLRVFRDKTDLSANPEMWPSILAALRDSEFLLLMACPEAACSAGVQREVGDWVTHRKPAGLLIAVTGGDLAWDAAAEDFDWQRTTALPSNLRSYFSQEPLWVDLRWARQALDWRLDNERFLDAVATLAAPLHHKEKRELLEKHHHVRRIARVTIAVLVALGLAVVAAISFAMWQRGLARSRERAAAAQMQLAGDPAAALAMAVEAIRIRDTPEARRALEDSLVNSHLHTNLRQNSERVSGAEFSPDGKRAVTWDDEGKARVWDVVSGCLLRVIKHTNVAGGRLRAFSSSRCRFTPDGKGLLVAHPEGTLRLWDAETGATVATLAGPFSEDDWEVEPVDVAFDPAGAWIASVKGSSVLLWDAKTLKFVKSLTEPGGEVASIEVARFASDGKTLIVGAGGVLRSWSMPEGKAIVRRFYRGPVGVSFDGKRLLTSDPNSVQVQEISSGQTLASMNAGPGDVTALALTDGGKLVFTGAEDGSSKVWRLGNKKPFSEFGNGGSSVSVAAFSPDGTRVLTGSYDGKVRVWDVVTDSKLAELGQHAGEVDEAGFSPDGNWVLTTAVDGAANLWRTSELAVVRVLERSFLNFLFTSMALTGDGTRALATSVEGETNVWDARTGRHVATLKDGPPATWVLPGYTGRWAITLRDDRTTALWDVDAGRISDVDRDVRVAVRTIASEHGPKVVPCLAASPDDEYVAACLVDGGLRVWRTADGRRLIHVARDLAGPIQAFDMSRRAARIAALHSGGSPASLPEATVSTVAGSRAVVWNVTGDVAGARVGRALEIPNVMDMRPCLSPDGRRLVIATGIDRAALWDIGTGKQIAELKGHNYVGGCVFSADGKRILTFEHLTDSIRIWDAFSGSGVATIAGRLAAFSPDGNWIVTGPADIRIWEAATGRMIVQPYRHVVGSNEPGARVISFGSDNTVVTLSESAVGRYRCPVCVSPERLFEAAIARTNLLLRSPRAPASGIR